MILYGWIVFGCRRRLVEQAQRALTVRRTSLRCGDVTSRETPSATHADFTSRCITYVRHQLDTKDSCRVIVVISVTVINIIMRFIAYTVTYPMPNAAGLVL